jgi:hypothetical protein
MRNDNINPHKKSFVSCSELATNISFVKALRPELGEKSDNNVLRLAVTSALKGSFGITHYFLRLYKYFSIMKDQLAPGSSDQLTPITNSFRRQFLVV